MDDSLSPNQIKQMINMLQSMLPDNKEPQNNDDLAQTETKESPVQRRHNSDTRINRFDSMPERDMHKADALIDKKLNVFPPSVRNRKFNLTKVTCRVCGKVEEVSPNLLFDEPSRYKCNKCARNAG